MAGGGMDKAGYKQISGAVDSKLITDTMGAVTGNWYKFYVVSSEVQLASVVAPGLTGDTLINSGTTWVRGAEFVCSQITSIKISAKSSNTAVIAHNIVLL